MSRLKFLFLIVFFSGSVAHAASSGGLGLYLGSGVPFLSQVGLEFKFNEKFGVSAGFNQLSVEIGEASLDLSMPEVLIHYHPFSGSFYIAAGVGQESLEATAIETIGTDTIKIEVDAMTTIAKLGWKWGYQNGGFWFGIDYAYIMPSSPETTITAPDVLETDQSYLDAVEAAEDFGDTAYGNFTFARLGYLF